MIGELGVNNKNNLIQVEPSGMINYYKAHCVGKNNKVVMEILEREYKDNMTIESAVKLCGKVMNEVIDEFESKIEIGIFDKSGLRFLNADEKLKNKDSLLNN